MVSDRFHLVDNLWRCLNSICQRVLPSLIPVSQEGAGSVRFETATSDEFRKETTFGRNGSKHVSPREESECDRQDPELELEDRQKI